MPRCRRRRGGQGERAGLPEPVMPVGWAIPTSTGCAYGYALALLGAIYTASAPARVNGSTPRNVGPAFSSRCDDPHWSANEREFRYGNRSPYKPAAPHGAYRCAGKDRWIAIACFTDDEWRALAPDSRARRMARRPPL